jgi:large subunit ribosomal protein L18
MNHVPIPRRRRSGQTDYGARKKAIGSRGVLLAVRISGKNVTAQFIQPKVNGDLVLSSSHSRELRKHGWKGSLKSTPACYLLGLLAGRKAKDKGVEEAFLYNGIIPFVRGSRVSAFAKGVVDSGLSVPVSKEVFPKEERLSGESIATFAAKLAKEDKDEYSRRFASMLKLGLKPEEYAAHHAQVRKTISERKQASGGAS